MIVRYGPPLFQILRELHSEYNVVLMKVLPDEARMFRDFLFYFLKNSIIVHYVISHSNRSAGQIGVSRETHEPNPMGLPSLADQESIVRTIMKQEIALRRHQQAENERR